MVMEEPVFAFTVGSGLQGSDPAMVTFLPTDVEHFAYFLVASRLSTASPSDVLALVESVTMGSDDSPSSTHVDNAGFQTLVNTLLSQAGQEASTPTVTAISGTGATPGGLIRRTLAAVYEAFKSESEAGAVDSAEFAIALSVFGGGSKSPKLEAAWRVMDTDEDGALSDSQLWRFLTSLLAPLLSCRRRPGPLDSVVTDGLVSVAVAVVEAVGEDGLVTFDAFGKWYNDHGYTALPWLELLDLRKWPFDVLESSDLQEAVAEVVLGVDAGENGGGEGGGDAVPVGSDEAEALGIDRTTVFQFFLGDADDSVLRLSFQDCAYLQRLLKFSQLSAYTPHHLLSSLSDSRDSEAITAGTLAHDDYNACLRALIPGEILSGDERTFTSHVFSQIFQAYAAGEDAGEEGDTVDFSEFASGFVIFGAGSKSDKLSLAWALFVAERNRSGASGEDAGDAFSEEALEDALNGTLDRVSLWRYLRGFLLMLSALSRTMSQLPDAARVETIDRYTLGVANAILRSVAGAEAVQVDSDVEITYEAFGAWYSEGGHRHAPWLELLDLRKWPDVLSDGLEGDDDDDEDWEDEGDDDEEREEGEEDEDDEEDGIEDEEAQYEDENGSEEGGEDAEVPVFIFPLSAGSTDSVSDPSTLHVRVMQADCAALHSLVTSTGFASTAGQGSPAAAVTAVANDSGSVDEAGMKDLAANLCGDGGEAEAARSSLLALYRHLAGADSSVPASKLTAALLLLAPGKKSEKLLAAHRAMCGKGSSALSRSSVSEYFSVFLQALLAWNAEAVDTHSPATLGGIAARTGASLGQALLRHVDGEAGGEVEGVEYSQVGAWYNAGGFDAAPWLELLDLRKWPRA